MSRLDSFPNRFIKRCDEFYHELNFPAERLADFIARSVEEGVGITPERSLMYDEDDDNDFTVDPSCDIRTDRFDLAEHLQASVSSRSAQSIVTPDVPTVPEVIMEPSAEPSHGAQADEVP